MCFCKPELKSVTSNKLFSNDTIIHFISDDYASSKMNDPNKKIDVNLSSLLSLKAELLRKQAEVSKVKASRSSETFIPSKAKTYKKDAILETPPTNEKDKNTKVFEIEDTVLLEKSKRVLEAKSKYYDRMAAMGGQLNSDDNCLVLFNRKKQEDPTPARAKLNSSSSSEDSDSDIEGHNIGPIHPDEEWVEYTDCLGRTRKCLQKDLDFVKKKDTELAASIPERLDQTKPNWMLDVSKSATESSRPPDSVQGDVVSVMSKHDEMRNNWEKKEVENLSKENVHYQDVFFDEARQHGVGYYAFSTDEEERARQQKELEEMRLKTLNEQAQREAQRNYREKIIAERVKAAKNRQRARLGLPPLEEETQEEKAKETPVESKEERKRRKKEEKLKRKKEKEDKIREEERQNHVRPWDKEKHGVRESSTKASDSEEEPWAYKQDRGPMSQEEWNERKRAERNPEFAPGAEKLFRRGRKRKERSSSEFEPMPEGKMPRTNFNANDITFPMPPPPPPLIPIDISSNFVPFQSTKKAKDFQRKNSSAFARADANEERRGAEIPPPLDLDPEPFIRPKPTQQSLENSIEAGLRFLRNNFDKTTMSTKSSWTARADY